MHEDDLGRLLMAFSNLRLRPGWVLRAHVEVMAFDGFARIYGVPSTSPSSELPSADDLLLEFSPPPAAAGHFMEAITADGSLRSYLEASFFLREVQEVGASWHGVNWGHHRLVDSIPNLSLARLNRGLPGDDGAAAQEWSWWDDIDPSRREPEEWRPTATRSETGVTVVFHTFCEHIVQAVWRHTDCYQPGHYQPESHMEELATAGQGYIT